jgi:hypothetical protein
MTSKGEDLTICDVCFNELGRRRQEGIGGCFCGNENIEDIRKKLQEINEHIKNEQNSLKFQYRIGQRDVLKWMLEE